MRSIAKSALLTFELGLLVCAVAILLPQKSLAQTNTYSLGSRSVFLTGCLLDDPPNFWNDVEVQYRMRACVCMLDKFQENYTDSEFVQLFSEAQNNRQPYQQELHDFSSQHIRNCI